MKLIRSLAGLAAVLSVVPYKVEKKECGEKKSYSLTSLTWKADYTPDTETEEATLNIDLLGGLVDTVNAVKSKIFEKKATPDFCETVEVETEAAEVEEAEETAEEPANQESASEEVSE
ncbi:MAG: hypothetical protein IJX76_09215 [Clostridia bacterium]|nr:hypothetical protein [Clostridia bacterium]